MSDSFIRFIVPSLLGGAALLALWIKFRLGGIERIAGEIIAKAEREGRSLEMAKQLEMKERQVEQQREIEQFWQLERKKVREEEERLKNREDKLEQRFIGVEKKLSEIEKREALLAARKEQIDEERNKIAILSKDLTQELERISGFTVHEAKEALLKRLESDVSRHAALAARRTIKEAQENADKEAQQIIATAINRLASSTVSESTVATVSIPNEDIKGRIIGREGRNIRALERATGVNFVIDDTPGAVVLSSFDPVRRHIAKVALSDLISDGRIHPTRIEETVLKATGKVQKEISQRGEDAALRAGAMGLHPEILRLLGKLSFRYSYGQNILEHSLEVSHLMGLMASELGLDVKLAKRIGLLHDMGKALTHEIQGTHALIGHDFALKYGESLPTANGIGCHHQEMAPLTVEGSLCSAADALSASRPGARIEAVEEYIKRIKRLEEIAYEFPGIEKAYVLQAGREIRVIVLPSMIDDDGLINLARDLTKRVESALDYPGKIKVTAIRETRAVEYAI